MHTWLFKIFIQQSSSYEKINTCSYCHHRRRRRRHRHRRRQSIQSIQCSYQHRPRIFFSWFIAFDSFFFQCFGKPMEKNRIRIGKSSRNDSKGTQHLNISFYNYFQLINNKWYVSLIKATSVHSNKQTMTTKRMLRHKKNFLNTDKMSHLFITLDFIFVRSERDYKIDDLFISIWAVNCAIWLMLFINLHSFIQFRFRKVVFCHEK